MMKKLTTTGATPGRLNRRDAIKAALAAGLVGPSLFLGAGASAATASLTVTDDRLKLLVFTDLHFFARTRLHDRRTLDEMAMMLDLFQPHLFVVDGDVCMENPMGQGLSFCARACEWLGALGRPWVYVRGNHDKADDFGECEALLASAPNSLFAGVGTNSNYTVEIEDGAGRVAWRLWVVNDAAPELGFGEEQIAWLGSEAARIEALPQPEAPAMLFCHIPLVDYAYLAASGEALGVINEKVCHENGSTEAIAAIRDTKTIKAMFCGHDHVNNYHGPRQGVRLEYVRATGYGGYGKGVLKKGGTLIEAELSGSGELETVAVFANGETWRPDSFKSRVR